MINNMGKFFTVFRKRSRKKCIQCFYSYKVQKLYRNLCYSCVTLRKKQENHHHKNWKSNPVLREEGFQVEKSTQSFWGLVCSNFGSPS